MVCNIKSKITPKITRWYWIRKRRKILNRQRAFEHELREARKEIDDYLDSVNNPLEPEEKDTLEELINYFKEL